MAAKKSLSILPDKKWAEAVGLDPIMDRGAVLFLLVTVCEVSGERDHSPLGHAVAVLLEGKATEKAGHGGQLDHPATLASLLVKRAKSCY